MNDLNKVVHTVCAAENHEQLEACIKELCSKLGMDFYSLLLLSPTSFVDPEAFLITNFPGNLERAYIRKECYSNDLKPLSGYDSQKLYQWGEISQYKKINHDMKYFAIEAEKEQISGGVVAVSRISMFSGALRFFYKDSKKAEANRKNIEFLLRGTINTFVTKAIDIYMKSFQGGIHFTKREKECLLWASEGKTAWETSKIVGISERTVIYHLQNVTEKLGVNTRQHAIAKAISLGFVYPDL